MAVWPDIYMSYSVPQNFGHYTIQEKIHEGWSADIYKATRKDLKRPVALKILHPDQDEMREQRLKYEAEALGRIRHPQVVHVHELGCYQQLHYLAMDFIDGIRLDHLIQSDQVRLADMVTVIMDLAATVQVLHDKSVVHRDIKPANVIIDMEEQPHLVGFGLARLTDMPMQDAIIGIPPYLAPEQTWGQAAQTGPWTDIWGLGITLYEMVTRKFPFRADTPQVLYQQINYEDPPWPRKLNPEISVDLETILLKSLEKQPEQRYASAKELADDLKCYLQQKRITARRSPRWRRRLKRYLSGPGKLDLLGGALLLLLGAAGTYAYFHYFINAPATPEPINTPQPLDWLARAQEKLAGQHYKQAIAAFNQAIAAHPDQSAAYQGRVQAYLGLSRSLPPGQENRYDQQIFRDLNKLLQLDPRCMRTYLLRGSLYQQRQRYREALQDFRNAVGINPNSVQGLLALGNIYLQLKQLDQGISHLELGIELSPRHTGLRLKCAQAYLQKGRQDAHHKHKWLTKALEHLNRVLSNEPQNFEAHYWRGMVYRDLQQPQQALREWQTCLRLDCNHPLAYKLQDEITKLRHK